MKRTSHHRHDYIRVLTMRTIGNFLILSSLFVIGKTFYLPARAEVRYFLDQYHKKNYVVATQDEAPKLIREFKAKEAGRALAGVADVRYEVLVPVDPDFSIVIPAIGANAKIIPNVDSAQRETYLEALQKGVAHAEGTAFPGESSHIFLFAHSTDYFWNVGAYNAVFYLLYKLQQSDEVNLFYKGQRYRYQVSDTQVVDASAVEYITRKTDHELLTLQTCWPPGTTLKRLLIFAKRVAE